MKKDEQITQKKKNTLLDAEVSDVFVVQNSKRRAYVEQFKHKGVNFTQKKLGTFLGFFIVRDSSASSANIVNFLTAEIKKEYFAFPKRGIAESFETALHRVNRALAEVANVGNVDWLGSIDGAVCAVDETDMYFSVTGGAAVLLMRGENIMDISEGLTSDEAKQHPLKTFIDISSGQLMAGDKIIITSPELLDLISFDELQRNALRLGRDNFVQFINTVLTNECKMAVTSIIDINEKISPVAEVNINRNIIQEANEEKVEEMPIPDNVFSAQVFEGEIEEQQQKEENLNDKKINDETESAMEDEEAGEYVDKRTGHIYLQGEEDEEGTNRLWSSISDGFKDLTRNIKEGTKKKFRRVRKKIKKFIESRKEENKTQIDSVMPANVNDEIVKLKKEIGVRDGIERNSKSIKINVVQNKKEKLFNDSEDGKFSLDVIRRSEKNNSVLTKDKNSSQSSQGRIINFFGKTSISLKKVFTGISNKFFTKVKNVHSKSRQEKNKPSVDKKSFSFFTVSKQSWKKVSGKNKIIGLTLLALILAVPLIFINNKGNDTENKDQNLTTEESENIQTENDNSNQENNENAPAVDVVEEPKIEGNINDPEEIYKGVALIYADKVNKYDVAITKDSVIILDDENIKYSLPTDSGAIKHATVMDDLNLVFLLTDKDKLFSFSPVSKKFESQSLNIDNKNVKTVGAYTTNLYVVTDDGIIRHTRKVGGFSEGNNWLKEEYDTSNIKNIAINGTIYVSNNKKIEAFFKYKKNNFKLENDQVGDLVYIRGRMNYLWLVNKEEATIYKFNKSTGKLMDKFTHDDIKNAVSFVIDEKTKTAIVNTSKQVLKFKLEKK
ncbi:MAG: hypothetical protein KAT32_02160 [Candidatus Moranbacteria bacterium]|nr:hypothetical protein [Candidatus Moranbacteria bacterium]